MSDSLQAIMSLNRRDLRKVWRFEFINEPGIDAGGLAREWYKLITEEIFDPDMGMWMSSAGNQMAMQINPCSGIVLEDHLVYFRFLGRVIGKAIFSQHLVTSHMVKYIYKHLLGWPISFQDLESNDIDYYNNLKQLTNIENVEDMYLDFNLTEDILGEKRDVDLIPNGSDIAVTNANLPEYMEASFKYRMLDRIKPQLNELLLGFYDIMDEPLLTIFDFQELELIMCGLPEIDMEDWMKYTEYSGEYEEGYGNHPSCTWFWEVVNEFDQEMKARLLQFATGTSGVPAKGFSVLQGNDGDVRLFTIHGVEAGVCYYPQAHTCFNRIDLPIYDSKETLKQRLIIAVTMGSTGFSLE